VLSNGGKLRFWMSDSAYYHSCLEAKAAGVLGSAVIGLGVGEQHARAYAGSAACCLRWVYDLNYELMERVITQIGQGAPAPAYEATLEDEQVQIVSIATFDDAHYSQVMKALAARKHVFVEKPMCRSLEELRDIKRAWLAAGRPHLASNLVLRAAPVYRWLKQSIGDGQLGTVYSIDGEYLYGRVHKITDGWRTHVENYSVMQGGGIHMVDLMLWLSGEKPVSVAAAGNRICTAGTAFRYHDFVTATYQFRSGLVGRITANFGCVHRHQHVLRVFGTRGTFVLDDMGARLHTSREPSASPKHLTVSCLPASKGDLIPAFIERVCSGGDSGPAMQVELDLICACLAVDEALATGASVPVEYL
jgi:predicted dehydrogenase